MLNMLKILTRIEIKRKYIKIFEKKLTKNL